MTNFQNSPKNPMIPLKPLKKCWSPCSELKSQTRSLFGISQWNFSLSEIVPQYKIYPKLQTKAGTIGDGAIRIYTTTFYMLKFKYENVKIKKKNMMRDYINI
jgi:hypothetical protein